MFLNAYMSVQQAEKLEADGQGKAALAKYRFAASALDQVHEKFPQWQPLIVEYRKKRTSESIARLEAKLGKGSVTATPPPTNERKPAGAPGDDFEPLPQKGDGIAPPSLTTGPENAERPDPNDPALQELQARMQQLQTQLKESRDQLKTVQRENEDLANKLKTALNKQKSSGDNEAQLKTRLAETESALKKALADDSKDAEGKKGLEKELNRLKTALRTVKIERDVIDDETEDLLRKVSKTQTQVVTVSKDRDQAVKEGTAARKANEELTGDLAKAQTQIGVVVKDRDLIAKQRDDALAELDKARLAQQQVDKLLADNSTLMQRLSDAEKTIKSFNSTAPEKDKEIASLRQEVGTVKEQLAAAQKQNQEFQGSMVDLQAQLEKATSDLAAAKATGSNAEERKKFTEENELLRGIVLRELKEGARRGRTKKLVLDELKKLEVQSTALLGQIEYLGQPTFKLTEKERALFKGVQLDLVDNEPAPVSIAIAAPKSDKATETAAKPAAPKTTNAPADEKTGGEATADGKRASETKPVAEGKSTAEAKPAIVPAETKPPGVATVPEMEVTSLQNNTAFPPEKIELSTGARTQRGKPGGTTSPAAPPGKKTVPGATTEPEGDLPVKAPGDETAPDATAPQVETAPSPNVPEELQPMAREAKEAFDRGQYPDAEKVYSRMLSKAPNNLYILSNLGVTRYRSGKLKLAEETFKKAIAVAPDDSFSHCTLGIIYYSQGKFDEAMNQLTKALAINPKMATAHNYLGITASQKGWGEAAQKELETAIAVDPQYADAYFNLAVVYATQQPPNKDLARKNYKRATELGADADSALEQLIK